MPPSPKGRQGCILDPRPAAAGWLPLGLRSRGAGVNDVPVARQSRIASPERGGGPRSGGEVTEPQRDGDREAVER